MIDPVNCEGGGFIGEGYKKYHDMKDVDVEMHRRWIGGSKFWNFSEHHTCGPAG